MLEQERGLAGIIEQQRRQHHSVPGCTNWLAADVPHVGIECLAAGDGEKNPAENRKPAPPAVRQEAGCIARIHRREHARMKRDAADA